MEYEFENVCFIYDVNDFIFSRHLPSKPKKEKFIINKFSALKGNCVLYSYSYFGPG
jgi:hypothetical protein